MAKAVLALEQSERHFRALIEMASDLVAIGTAEGEMTYVSPSIEPICGYAPAEVLGRNFLEFVHADDRQAARANLAELLRHPGKIISSEWRYRHKAGHWLTLQTSSRNLLEDPAVAGIVVRARDVTERRRVETELEFKNIVLATEQENSLDAILIVDENAMITSYNRRFVELWKIPDEALRSGKDEPVLSWALAQTEDPDAFLAKVRYLYAHREEKSHDELRLKDGRTVERHSAPFVAKNGRYLGRVWYFRDVTEQKAAAERIQALNVLYAMLSGVNHAIVQSGSRADVGRRICDLVIKSGMWRGIWIGFVDGATKRVVPESWSESMAPYIERMVVSVDPALPEGQGPTGTAARTGVPYFCNDVFADPATLPWRKFAESFGINTVAAVPLRLGKTFVGVVNLYSVQKEIYTPQVQALLIELGADVSFALTNFENEQLRLAAENTLAESEAKFRGVVEQSISGIYIIQDRQFAYVNPYFAEIFGYEAGELVGLPFEELVAESERERVSESIRERLSGKVKSLQYTFTGRRKDGSLIDIGVHGTVAAYGGRPAIVGLLQDITERRQAEERARQYTTQLEKAMFGTIDAVTAMLDLRDPYTSGHQHRVGELAGAIGTELGLSEHEVKGLRVIGRIHDVGKISVPAEILSKPGKLNPIEFEMIKSHSQQGYDILKSVEFPWPVAETVLQHHERLDGSGYPRGLKGDDISLSARILAVADTVEAMATHRPYRPALGIEAALGEVERQSSTRYDAKVVAACLRLFRDKGYVLQK
jgi:PAS domain S-box-containing protein